MSRYASPLRYPGGKGRIFPFVSRLLCNNGLLGISYAEPYAGGAGLALQLLFDEYVESVYLNDLDYAVFAFWDCILNRNDEFCSWVEDVNVSVETWRECKEIYRAKDSFDIMELAKAVFFINRTSVSGVLKSSGLIGGYSQKGKYKIDARFDRDKLIERIKKIGAFRGRIIFSNLDALSFIRKLSSWKKDVFIYIDPPYYKKGADLYMNYYSDIDHVRLSKVVRSLNKQWMVSYDMADAILDLYGSEKKVTYKLLQSTSNRVGDEVLFFSEDLNIDEAIKLLPSARRLDVKRIRQVRSLTKLTPA